MRRILAGSAVCLAMTATLVALPVYTAPVARAEPVPASVDEVVLGSVVEPEGDAVVATDGEVQPGGVAEPSGSTPSPSPSPSPSPAPAPAEEDVPVSGEEIPGVPALTVSQPDTDYFESVGVTWTHDETAADVVAQIRVKSPEGTWGEWFTLATDDAVQRSSAETEDNEVRDGTAPYWTGPAEGLEVVVQAADGTAPDDVRVALIDPGESAADALPESAQPADSAGAAGAMPRVYTRAEWGADESIREWDPEYPSTIKAATIHHTADSNNYTAENVPSILRSMYAYHTLTRGWGDIGYNVIVDKFGRIFEGRYGGLTSTVVGAHAGGFNTFTFGVSMLGNYDVVPVPQATVNAVSEIVAWKLGLYRVDPRGTTVLTSGGGGTSKYAAGTRVTLPTVFAHRDVGATACPGRYGFARMAEIRERVTTLSSNRSLLRSLTDTTVYLVSGSNRYAVPDAATLHALRPLGGVGYVADRYLAGFTEGPELPRVVLAPTGTVYFLDAGMKLRFNSCGMVADYGADCSSLVRLDQSLIDAFATGPAITSLYRTTSGKAFYVSGGAKREVADDASLTAAGLPTSGVRLLESGLDYLPVGVPVVRDGITLRNRQTGAAAVAAGGQYTVLSPAVLQATAVSSWPVRDLDYASLRRLTISSAPGAFVRETGGSDVFLLTETGRREVTDASLAPVSVPQVPAALLAAFPDAGTLDAGTFLKGSAKGTVYFPDEGRRRPVLSWADLVAIRAGGPGPILTIDQRLVDLLPTGPAQLGPGSLVMSPAARTVYFVNGLDELIPVPSFNVSGELGSSRLARVTAADVAGYSARTARLTTAIDCGGTQYLGLGGKRYQVGAGVAAHYGLSYTSVDTRACASLPVASMGLTRFLRASTGTIYYIENGKKRPIRTYARYSQLGGTSSNTIQTSDFALAQIPTGTPTG